MEVKLLAEERTTQTLPIEEINKKAIEYKEKDSNMQIVKETDFFANVH